MERRRVEISTRFEISSPDSIVWFPAWGQNLARFGLDLYAPTDHYAILAAAQAQYPDRRFPPGLSIRTRGINVGERAFTQAVLAFLIALLVVVVVRRLPSQLTRHPTLPGFPLRGRQSAESSPRGEFRHGSVSSTVPE